MRIALIALTGCLLSFFSGFSQDKQNEYQQTDKNRKPAVAGQFYPKNPGELEQSLEKLFRNAPGKKREKPVQAIITPHAGYIYSGTVAASAFKQVDPQKKFDNIFIIATSHRTRFNGASIYSAGNYETPLGIVKVNKELSKKLIDSHKVFQFNEQAHSKEHSLEVQLPFIQYYFQSESRIIPIVTGTDDPAVCGEIANALRPYFNDDNLFVISTDFSHFPSYEDAKKVDEATADAIVSNSPQQITKIIDENAGKNIPNLQTSLCGWPGVLTLLYMTSELDDVETEKILYQNSGDQGGEKNRVVGYWSIVFYRNQNGIQDMSFQLQPQEKQELLKIARKTLESYIREGKKPEIEENRLTETLKEKTGAFVTLNKKGNLRGCIGRFEANMPLYQIVQEMTVAASTQDIRFSPVKEDELDEIDIEISVLTPMKKVSSADEIELGKHGVYIKNGPNAATFLPQVAQSTGWSKEEFLGHLARDKAGLSWEAWQEKDTELYTYEAIVIEEKHN